ncbi:MAG TPA: TolC family protein [Rhizomicrobium sp.]|nr:TolC family protein [Rhizomicrobium sp.]
MARFAFCVLALLLAGCATDPPQVLTPQYRPKAFVGPIVASAEVWPKSDWWNVFDSTELSGLVTEAQANNLDLAAAASRVLAADAQVTIERSALFPQVTGGAQAERSAGPVVVTSGSGNNRTTTATGNDFGLGFGATYQLDFWGLARDNLRSANEALKSARFAQEVVALTMTSSVADQYMNVLALRQRIAIANENIAAINAILDVIKLKVSAGASSDLDLAQEEAQVESVEAQLPSLEEQEVEARYALALLLGRPPEQFDVKARNLDALAAPAVAPGLPSALLLRRPDVAEAEANLAAAHANVDAARAAYFPQIGLSANGGYASAAVSTLLHGSSFGWDIGANLLQTVFDGGKLSGQEDLAKANETVLVADYRQAVLSAYSDVETALQQVANNTRARDHLVREIAAAQQAFDIAKLQYEHGTTDLLTVLQAQQTLFSAEDQLAQVTQARLEASVHLYEALGGGWSEDPNDRTQLF